MPLTTITITEHPRLDELNDAIERKTTTGRSELIISSPILEGGLKVKLGKIQSKWYSKEKNRLTLKFGEN